MESSQISDAFAVGMVLSVLIFVAFPILVVWGIPAIKRWLRKE